MPKEPLSHYDPIITEYNLKGFKLLQKILPSNPNYKCQAGEFIFEYVEKIVGEQRTPKITGMLLDLSI